MLYALLIGERGPGLAGWLAYSGASRCGSHGVYNSVLPEMNGSDRSMCLSICLPQRRSADGNLHCNYCKLSTSTSRAPLNRQPAGPGSVSLSTRFLVGLQASIRCENGMQVSKFAANANRIVLVNSPVRHTISTRYIILPPFLNICRPLI
jgi:hypothetical protein